jgi:hypothetical protein
MGLLKTQLRSRNLRKMMKYQLVLLPLMNSSTSLFPLHNKKMMRLITLLSKILMILYFVIWGMRRRSMSL